MKTALLKIILLLLFLVVFNTFFFLFCGTENKESVWISYGFVHFSYLVFLLSIFMKTKGEAGYYLTVTSIMPAWAYFTLELIVGVVFICIKMEEIMWPVLTQGTLALLFVGLTVASMLTGEVTANQLEQRKVQTASFQQIASTLRCAIDVAEGDNKTLLKECYTVLSTSGTRQTDQTVAIDAEILLTVQLIFNSLSSGTDVKDSITRLSSLCKQRKTLNKYSN